MRLYAESSAVLRWLLRQPDGDTVKLLIRDAGAVVASRLTVLETRRGLKRAPLAEADAAAGYGLIFAAETAWDLISVDAVLERAEAAFPVEPVRSLDAIHLATALLARERYPDLAILSTDNRVRTNALALGFIVVPDLSPGPHQPR